MPFSLLLHELQMVEGCGDIVGWICISEVPDLYGWPGQRTRVLPGKISPRLLMKLK
jgi:hypothetical protein